MQCHPHIQVKWKYKASILFIYKYDSYAIDRILKLISNFTITLSKEFPDIFLSN